ncbi:hypothetical protein CFIMG_003400RA [Ceratocystis fimbriata CBS 114723]|uniref:Uncharacterized protein n=1 Tax=Ceratocystis fimbriata CBS 114723 TaxID=1035309 RepID=A0A2C5XCP9_9PEZI|nr:hypothetical protein CFIMG_003400RA [Ceratocystis fimbriata CBS 114723]
MPNPIALTVGIAAITVAAAAAIIIYESPEVRRYAKDVHRRFAKAMPGRRGAPRSNGASVDTDTEDYEFQEPLYNRPEDADGFMMSSQHRNRRRSSFGLNARSNAGADSDMDLDSLDNDDDVTEEARRRQREELDFWNAIHESQEMENARRIADEHESLEQLASKFDDVLNAGAATGATGAAGAGGSTYNSGANIHGDGSGLRRRGDNQSQSQPQSRGFGFSYPPVYQPPGVDTGAISATSAAAAAAAAHTATSAFDDVPDIYSATNSGDHADLESRAAIPYADNNARVNIEDSETASSLTLDRAATPTSETPMNPFSDINEVSSQDDAFASIQAWAEQSNESFFSPMPMSPHAVPSTPTARSSEPAQSVVSLADEVSDEGAMTPTDSVSVVSSSVHVAMLDNDTVSNEGSRYDVISQTDGMLTPASWSEVGSVVSDDDMHVPA